MFVQYEVTVKIYIGLERTRSKLVSFPVAFDDLEDDLCESEIKDLVVREVNSKYRGKDPGYGKFWEIVDMERA